VPEFREAALKLASSACPKAMNSRGTSKPNISFYNFIIFIIYI